MYLTFLTHMLCVDVGQNPHALCCFLMLHLILRLLKGLLLVVERTYHLSQYSAGDVRRIQLA